jgi:hypothetical protein
MKKSIRSTRKLTGGKQLLFAFARHAGGVLEISGGGYLIKKKQTKNKTSANITSTNSANAIAGL